MDLSKYLILGETDKVTTLRLQNSRLIQLRWYYISLLPAVAAVSNFAANNPNIAKRYIAIGCTGLILNAFLFAYCRKAKKASSLQVLMLLQLAIDISIAAFVTFLQGGAEARTTALFAFPIVAAGLIFSSLAVYVAAGISIIAYSVAVVCGNYGARQTLEPSEMIVPLIFYPAFFIIFAQLVVYLSNITTTDTREQAYDSFLALLSHQLKHPVSTVNAIIDLLEHENLTNAKDRKKYVKMLKNENQSLLLLLENLLEAASSISYISDKEEIDVPKQLQKIAYRCADAHSRTSDLKLHLKELSLTAKANSGTLTISLTNVINNAFQYSSKETPVTIHLSSVNKNVMITVENVPSNKESIPKEKLFKKYSERNLEKDGAQGLGLGLYVAKKIIDEHHGSLHVLSDEKSTKVIITLKRRSKL